MAPLQTATTLVIATGNRHKVDEIRGILAGPFEFFCLKDFPTAPKVVEDATTFAGNAQKKSVELARWLAENPSSKFRVQSSKLYVLADDSGLEVDALGGAPGVHSARFAALEKSTGTASAAAGNSPDAANNAKLLRLLESVPLEKRTARFRCVLALTPVLPAPAENRSPVCLAEEAELLTELFEGVCEGRIGFAPRGAKGFGYDPLFIPAGYQQTFAELGEEVKNRISHRARALERLRDVMRDA